MLQSHRLNLLALALLTFALPCVGQTDTSEPAVPREESSTTSATDTAAARENAQTERESPFDYRASEEISEDVPVSFPVDI
jgi:hypothetical protein